METEQCEHCQSILIVCAQCKRPFPRKPHEDERSWGARVYCSTTCAAQARRVDRGPGGADVAVKPCAYSDCDQLCRQRPNESPSSFQSRKYCSQECSAKARRGEIPEHLRVIVNKRKEDAQARKAALAKAKREDAKARKEAAEAERRARPLIRKVERPTAPVPAPAEAPPTVWRPAAWRAMDAARR
jgi:hypothetical protein